MSGTALAQPSSQKVQVSPTRRARVNPLEAVERGFALFRSTFAREAWRYYLGAVPFVACFIPIWVLNGKIRISTGALLLETAVLAASYFLRVWMVGSYMRQVRHRAFGTPTLKPAGALARAALIGRLLAWKIMLGTGAVLTSPSLAGGSWFYGACQFAALEVDDPSSERQSFSGCLGLSTQWFGPGLLLLFMLVPLWGAVWLNAGILALALPEVLHSVFGVDTLLSTQMGVMALIQSSAFWLSLFAGAWLALDPVVKCTFVIVYQHLRSRREGDDLRGLLASLPHEQEKKMQAVVAKPIRVTATRALVVLAIILASFSFAVPLHAAQIPSATSITDVQSGREARIEKLRTALNQESQRAIYRWHDAEHPSPPTWFDRLMAKIGEAVKRAWTALTDLLHKLWPRGLNLSLGSATGGGWHLRDMRFWLTVIAILTLVATVVFLKLRRRREATSLSVPIEIAPVLDLSDTSKAIERSEDEWFALASHLEGAGELRLAIRAAYFGLLAGLAQREWLTLRRDRTNREYLNEFTRRWRRRPQAAVEARIEVPERLRGSLRQFDRVWYGSHAVTPEGALAYRQDQREFLNHV